MHVPAECVPPWLYEHQLQAAVRLHPRRRRQMGKDSGARLFAKSPSPDPSAKTLRLVATGLPTGRERTMRLRTHWNIIGPGQNPPPMLGGPESSLATVRGEPGCCSQSAPRNTLAEPEDILADDWDLAD